MLSSATLDAEKFADFFAPPKRKKWDLTADQVSKHPESVALMSVEGRQHPVSGWMCDVWCGVMWEI